MDYLCKCGCGRPVERTIEGELITAECWMRQQDPESYARNKEIEDFLNTCLYCDNKLKPGKEKKEQTCSTCAQIAPEDR